MSTGRLARLTSGVAGAAAVITALTLLARVTGFARWFALNAWVGPNAVGSAYATANTVPNVLYEVAAGGALAGTVVPLLAGALARHLRADVDRVSSALLSWALLVLVPVGAFTWLAAPWVVQALLSSGAPAGQRELAATLLRIFAWQIPLYGVGVVLSGVLQAHRRFVGPALAPFLSSVVVIASYYVVGRLVPAGTEPGQLSGAAVAWLGWGTTAGVVALSLPLLVPVHRAGVRLRPTLHFPPGVARRARALALAGAGGLLAQQVSVVVTVRLANAWGGAGALNVNQYATAVVLLPYAVLAIPLATAMFPRLAQHAATGRGDELARDTARSTRVLVLVSVAGAAALVAAAWRVQDVFAAVARGGSVDGMAQAVVAGAPSVLGLALMYHLSRVLFATEHARHALVGTSVGWVAVAGTAWLLVATTVPDGGDATAVLRALGAASSVGTLIGAAVLAVAVRGVVGPHALTGLARTATVAVAGGVVGAGAGLAVAGLAPDGGVVVAVLLGLLGGGLAAAITAGGVLVGDRSTMTALRTARRRPGAADTTQTDENPEPAGPAGPAQPTSIETGES